MNVTLNETLHSMKMSEREQTFLSISAVKIILKVNPWGNENPHSISSHAGKGNLSLGRLKHESKEISWLELSCC